MYGNDLLLLTSLGGGSLPAPVITEIRIITNNMTYARWPVAVIEGEQKADGILYELKSNPGTLVYQPYQDDYKGAIVGPTAGSGVIKDKDSVRVAWADSEQNQLSDWSDWVAHNGY